MGRFGSMVVAGRGFEVLMDSYQRLIEGLPARDSPGRGRPASERAIRDAAAALPLANPAQALREVGQLLDGMLAVDWKGSDRLAALEHLRAPVASLCHGADRQLAAESHPLSPAGAARAAAVQRLQWQLVDGYALGLHELCAPTGTVPRFKSKTAAIAAVRGLAHADPVLMWAYRQYQSPPVGIWRRVHALHAFAVEIGLATRAVDDPLDGGTQTARGAYLELLLLAMSNPYRFSARELQESRQVIHAVAGLCVLGPVGAHSIAVDGDSDAGPGYVAEDRIAAGAGVFGIDVSPVERWFDERIAQLPAGVDAVDLPQPGAGSLTTSVRFLDHLRAGWGIAPRGRARLRATHSLDLVVGMHALHYALSGNLDFANFVRRIHGDAIMVGAQELASSWMATADTTRPARFRGEVIDQSEGGYRIRLAGIDGLRVRIGEIVGMAPAGEEEDCDWMVGVIRWLRRDGDAELLGIELLRREARAVGLRPLTAGGETLAPLRAVELLAGGDSQHRSLLVTNRLAANVVAAEVTAPAVASDWRSQASIATWRTGDTEVLGPACVCVTLEHAGPAGAD